MDAVLEALAGEIRERTDAINDAKRRHEEEVAQSVAVLEQLRALEATAKEIRVSRNGDEGGGLAVREAPVKPHRQKRAQARPPRSAASRSNGAGVAATGWRSDRTTAASEHNGGLVLAAFRADPEAWLSPGELARRLGVTTNQLKKPVDRLLAAGEVEHNGRPRAGSAYRLKGASRQRPTASPPVVDDSLTELERSILDTAGTFGRARDDLYTEVEGTESDIDVALSSLTTRRLLRKVTRHGATVYVAVATP